LGFCAVLNADSGFYCLEQVFESTGWLVANGLFVLALFCPCCLVGCFSGNRRIAVAKSLSQAQRVGDEDSILSETLVHAVATPEESNTTPENVVSQCSDNPVILCPVLTEVSYSDVAPEAMAMTNREQSGSPHKPMHALFLGITVGLMVAGVVAVILGWALEIDEDDDPADTADDTAGLLPRSFICIWLLVIVMFLYKGYRLRYMCVLDSTNGTGQGTQANIWCSSFWLHCLPGLHQLALCQEARAVRTAYTPPQRYQASWRRVAVLTLVLSIATMYWGFCAQKPDELKWSLTAWLFSRL
jgi:hypothetical protein